MKELERYRNLCKKLPDPVREAEVNCERTSVMLAGWKDGKPASKSFSDVTGLYVRAGGERMGFAYTENLEEDPVSLLMRAYDNGCLGSTASKEPMLSCPEEIEEEKEEGVTGGVMDFSCLEEEAGILEERIRNMNPLIQSAEVTMMETARTTEVVNSTGLCRSGSSTWYETELVVAAGGNGQWNQTFFYSGKRLQDGKAVWFKRKIGRWLMTQQTKPGKTAGGGKKRAVLDAAVMTNILATFWQALDAVHYETGSSVWAGLRGEIITSPAVSITDYPVHELNGYEFLLDCEGVRGEPVKLIENGRFTGLLHTLATAERCGDPAKGNAGRKNLLSGSLHTNVVPVPRNFVMEPGKTSWEELFGLLENGIYIHESYDVFHSINISSGEFHIPCKGIVIKQGKMCERVEGLTIDGNLKDLFGHILTVGDDLTFRPMDILKSYCVAASSVLVDKVSVSGI